MSSLKRRDRALLLWSQHARFRTYIKLAWCLDEGTLGVGNKVRHVGAKPVCKNLRNYFGNGMDEAYRSKVGDPFRILFLG